MSVKRPDPVDVEVGHRIRIERLSRGLSQTALANQLGVTFQQVQKYEKGVNRVGAGRLTRIAEVLGVPVATFFSGKEMLDSDPTKESGNASPLQVQYFNRDNFPAKSISCSSNTRSSDGTSINRVTPWVESSSISC